MALWFIIHRNNNEFMNIVKCEHCSLIVGDLTFYIVDFFSSLSLYTFAQQVKENSSFQSTF